VKMQPNNSFNPRLPAPPRSPPPRSSPPLCHALPLSLLPRQGLSSLGGGGDDVAPTPRRACAGSTSCGSGCIRKRHSLSCRPARPLALLSSPPPPLPPCSAPPSPPPERPIGSWPLPISIFDCSLSCLHALRRRRPERSAGSRSGAGV
jgi:hypothetical protein